MPSQPSGGLSGLWEKDATYFGSFSVRSDFDVFVLGITFVEEAASCRRGRDRTKKNRRSGEGK